MSRVWTAAILAVVGLLIGSGAGLPGALLVGTLAGWFGWWLTRDTGPAVAAPPAAGVSVPLREQAPSGATARPAPQPGGPVDAYLRSTGKNTDEGLDIVAAYLEEAAACGLLPADVHRRLAADLASRRSHAAAAAAPQPILLPTRPVAPEPDFEPTAPTPPAAERPAPPAPPARPASVATAGTVPSPPALLEGMARAARKAWEALVSDVAVHGLAYLGVLLVFVATFGFVVFAFSGVGSAWRPVAEVAIPTVLFGASWFLRDRGAPFVAASLELLAGAVTPVVLFAAFGDGAAFPPDLERAALVATLATLALALAGAYALVSARRSTSPLRWLVTPMVWLAAGVLGLVFEEGASASAMALVAAAVLATTAAARVWPAGRFSRPAILTALPGMAMVYALLLLLAAADGWPPVPVIAGGAMAIVLIEILGDRVPLAWAAQGAVVAVTAAAAVPALELAPASAAAAVSFLVLAELWERRAAPVPAAVTLLAAAAAAIAASVQEPVALLVAASLGSAWSAARLTIPPDSPTDVAALIGTAALPAASFYAIGALTAPGPALTLAAAAAAVVAAGALATRAEHGYPYLWAVGYGGAVLAGTALGAAAGEPAAWMAVAAGLATVAVAAAARSPVGRVWTAAAGGAWTLLLALDASAIRPEWWPAAFAAAGAGAVLTGTIGAARSGADGRPGHVAAAGHLTVAAALAWPVPDAPRLAALAIWTGAWFLETLAGELRRSPLAGLLLRVIPAPSVARGAAPALAATGLPLTLALAAHVGRWFDGDRGWMALALAALALAYAATARATHHRRPLAPVIAAGGFFLAGVAIAVAAPQPWPSIAAVTTAIGVVFVVSSDLRRPFMMWTAWALSAVLAVLLAERAGVPARHLDLVLMGWGGSAALGALLTDRQIGGRPSPGDGIRAAWLQAPFALGVVAVPVALSYVIAGSPGEWWPWAAAGAAFYGAVALLLRVGSISAAAWGLAALAAAGLMAAAGVDPVAEPVVLLPVAAGILVASFVLEWLPGSRDPWLGWDLAPLVVGHGVAAAAMVAALDASQVPAVFAGAGGLALVTAAWKRSGYWAAAGDVAVIIGAAVAGPGWLALALAANSAAAAAGELFAGPGPIRSALGWLAAGFAGASWVAAVSWGAWWPDPALAATAAGSGALVLAAAALVRGAPRHAVRTGPWVALAGAGIAAALLGASEPGVDRVAVGLALATGLAAWAVATAASASPLSIPALRHASVLPAGGAAAALGWAGEASAATVVAVAIPAAMALTTIGLLLWAHRPAGPWSGPAALAALAANAAGVAAGLTALPDGSLLSLALAATGAQALSAGVVTRTAVFFYGGLPTLLGAWLVLAADSLGGEPNWYTIPIGLTILATVDVARWDRRRTGRRPAPTEVVTADLAGMALLVAASLTQSVSAGPEYGLAAILLGAGLAGYGIATRVKRRCYFGAGAAVIAALLMVAVPLAGVIPQFRGIALWATVAAIGTILILTATYLEQGRARVAAGMRRLDEIMGGWE